MAFSFILGALAGLYTGVVLREEYYFPTSDKIAQALELFKKNYEAIEEAKKMPESAEAPKKVETLGDKKG